MAALTRETDWRLVVLRAVFARTLKPGVTYEQFKDAWSPEGLEGRYPTTARVSRNVADDRQVITIIELDIPVAEFKTASASLTHPDSVRRLERLIESTQLQAVYEDVFDEVSLVG